MLSYHCFSLGQKKKKATTGKRSREVSHDWLMRGQKAAQLGTPADRLSSPDFIAVIYWEALLEGR